MKLKSYPNTVSLCMLMWSNRSLKDVSIVTSIASLLFECWWYLKPFSTHCFKMFNKVTSSTKFERCLRNVEIVCLGTCCVCLETTTPVGPNVSLSCMAPRLVFIYTLYSNAACGCKPKLCLKVSTHCLNNSVKLLTIALNDRSYRQKQATKWLTIFCA